MDSWGEHYHLYWLELTGEIVAIADGPIDQSNAWSDTPVTGRRTELLAWAPDLKHAGDLLKGWASHTRELRSYFWLRKQSDNATRPAVAGDRITEHHRSQARDNAGTLF